MDFLTIVESPALGLIPAAFAALLVLDWIRMSEAAVRGTDDAAPCYRPRRWSVSPAGALFPFLMLAAWALLPCVGLIATSIAAMLGCSAVAFLAGAIGLHRGAIRQALLADTDASRGQRMFHHALLDLIVLAGVVAASFFAIEQPYNNTLACVQKPFLYIDVLLMALPVVVLYFLGQRRAAGPSVTCVLYGVMGLAQYYLWRFKNTAILPADLWAAGTAAAVAGGYSYTLQDPALIGLACATMGVGLASLLGPDRRGKVDGKADAEPKPHATRDVIVNIACAAVTAACMVAALVVPNYTQMGAKINYFWPLYTYRQHGAILSFVAGSQDLVIHKPSDYSDEKASSELKALVTRYNRELASDASRKAAESQFEGQKPSIVVVMNETFADMSIYDKMKSGYEGPKFFNTGMTDALSHGALSVSVNGGGTANTEFEFLTGNSMAFLGLGKYPYSIYDFSDCEALPKQLAKLGYASTAIHPNYPSNWNRKSTYEGMGFDQFLSIEDFPEDAPRFHNGLTDKVTYDKILELLRTGDEPQFVFDVTMQNHSDYNVGNIPADRLTDYQPEGISGDTNALLNEYLSCIQASDEDLEYFVGELKKLDRPVILVFFGDHQTNFASTYNDAWYTGESELAHNQRLYQTVYTMWANYDVAGNNQATVDDYTSPAYLAAMTLNAVGAPLSDYQKAELVARKTMPAINAFGYLGTNGKWYETDDKDSPMSGLATELDDITYLRFARKLK